ncbi:hypothetical protein DMUE_6104, partial [Dictyocoela muelleri]
YTYYFSRWKIYRLALFILKLKKIPKDLNSKVLVDLNLTGMWSVQLTSSFIKRNILSRPETMFAREPVLLIMDSFSEHLKLAIINEKYNVFIYFIPKCMTPPLQMLDVIINRSFQQFYGDCKNEYMEIKLKMKQIELGQVKLKSLIIE